VDKLKELRKLALRHFISDYADGVREKRYIKGMLPRLPFGDKAFDLVLSGHFIFTYSHRFDFSFILTPLVELVRVSCRDVRIYPIQKSSLQPYEHMTKLLDILKRKNRIDHKIVTVSFEFQKGSNKMLRLSHKK
jgi:ubiquinone/menaquinone biosynthesis C-methylase UbiE